MNFLENVMFARKHHVPIEVVVKQLCKASSNRNVMLNDDIISFDYRKDTGCDSMILYAFK